ncbi:MAG: restriction endonuclease, partial [Magnetovibrio sp.]|nr:restriction endonuclease [Magnetovibrio sp.]
MVVPNFQELMRPVLECASSGEVKIGDVVEQVADKLALSQEDRDLLLPSGRQTRFANRVHWAKSYL